MTAGVTIEQKTVALTRQLLSEAREELQRADGKAATLFALFGIALGAVLAGAIAGDWTPTKLDAAARVIWWIGAACAVGALVSLGSAVWPRLVSAEATGRVTYFAHVAAYRTREALIESLERQASDDTARPVEQLQAISGIVMTKYRRVQLGIALYGIGALACMAAVLVS